MHVPVDSDDDNTSDDEDEDDAGTGRLKEEGGKGTGTGAGGGDGVDAAALHLSDLSLFDPELGHRQGSSAGENPFTYRHFPRYDS